MMRSKIKSTIIVLAIALLVIGIAAIIANALLPVPDIQGTWEGTLNLPGSGVHAWESPKSIIVVRIMKTNGAYQANLDDIGGANQYQLETFIYKYPNVHGQISSAIDDFSFFTGKVSRLGGTMTWKACVNNYVLSPVVFRRTTHPTPFPEPLTEAEFTPRDGSALQGFWAGRIGRGKSALHIQFKIAEASDGKFRAEFYDPDQSTNRFPATVSYDGGTVKLTLMAGYGMFEGWLRNGGKDIIGNWVQGGGRTTTTLTQEDYSDFEAQGAK